MDSMSAFALGEAAKGNPRKVFDWDQAAKRIAETKPRAADAGLEGDLEWTGGAIWRDGAIVPQEETYTYLASTWATPILILDGEEEPCWKWEEETPGWDSGTYWPESARLLTIQR